MISNIDDLRGYLSKNELQSKDIISAMVVLRVQMESDNILSDYKWLKLFCDWCVHPKISKTALAIDIFETFYSALAEFDFTHGDSMAEFYDSFFDSFRSELQFILNKYNMSIRLANNDRVFTKFIIGILYQIKDRPLLLPEQIPVNGKNKERIKKLPELLLFAKNHKNIDLTPQSLYVEHDTGGNFDFILITSGQGEERRVIFKLKTVSYKNKVLNCAKLE